MVGVVPTVGVSATDDSAKGRDGPMSVESDGALEMAVAVPAVPEGIALMLGVGEPQAAGGLGVREREARRMHESPTEAGRSAPAHSATHQPTKPLRPNQKAASRARRLLVCRAAQAPLGSVRVGVRSHDRGQGLEVLGLDGVGACDRRCRRCLVGHRLIEITPFTSRCPRAVDGSRGLRSQRIVWIRPIPTNPATTKIDVHTRTPANIQTMRLRLGAPSISATAVPMGGAMKSGDTSPQPGTP